MLYFFKRIYGGESKQCAADNHCILNSVSLAELKLHTTRTKIVQLSFIKSELFTVHDNKSSMMIYFCNVSSQVLCYIYIYIYIGLPLMKFNFYIVLPTLYIIIMRV